jgi:type I restriction enzyme, S subunit
MKTIDKKGWKKVCFGDVCRNVNETEKYPLENGIDRYVGLEHIETGNLHIRCWGMISEGTTFTKKFSAGHVLFGKRRAYLKKAALAVFDGLCSGDILVFEANQKLMSPKLLPFLVSSDRFFDYAVQTSAGSLSPRTKFQDLKDFEFLLPPKDHQEQLAELLWAGDEVIEKYLDLGKKKSNIMTIVRNQIACNNNFRRGKFDEVLADIVPGRSLNATSSAVASHEVFGVLKVSAVGPNGFAAEENKRLIQQSSFIPKFMVNKGDLLITRANTRELVGRVCLVNQSFPNLMLSDKTLRLELDSNIANKLFYMEVLRSTELRNQIEGAASGTGGAMKNISQNEIRNLIVPIIPLATQLEISNKIQAVERFDSNTKATIDILRQLKSEMINMIF